MNNKRITLGIISFLVFFMAAGDLSFFVSDAFSRGFRGGGFGGRSFSRFSSPSKNVWGGRQSSGLFGSRPAKSSSRYAKPAAKTTSANTYGKPRTKSPTKSSYSKPGSVKKAASPHVRGF